MRAEEEALQTTGRDIGIALANSLRRRIGDPRFNLWFQDRTEFTWNENQLVVGVANRICQEWLEKKYAADIAAAVQEVLGGPVSIRYHIDPELFQKTRSNQKEAKPQETGIPDTAATAGSCNQYKSELPKRPTKTAIAKRRKPARRHWRKLADFVIGPCNRVAHASALAVVAHPGLEISPLVVHGPVGTGKTHILEGIYVDLRRRPDDLRVRFLTAEDFTNRFLQAMHQKRLSVFRNQFRDCDALLLDDLHFLAGKRATQEEFVHTFDALLADGRQIVVTCDCHPRLNDGLLPELIDRLLGGGIWGVMPPDYDTRQNLLRNKSAVNDRTPLADEVVTFLADNLHGNVREIEGALNSLYHFSRVVARPIDVAMAREVLGDLLHHSIRIVKLGDVDQAVRGVLRLDAGALQSNDRRWAYSHPRMIAMYLARRHTSATYMEVGKHFGNRSHSTVVAAEKKIRRWLEEDHHMSLGPQRLRVRDIVERAQRELL